MPLLQGMSPDRKPETFVEDSAVAPERLGEYIRQFPRDLSTIRAPTSRSTATPASG